MDHLQLYLESLTLEQLCDQNQYSYAMVLNAGITKKQIITGLLQKQTAYNKNVNEPGWVTKQMRIE